MALQCVDLIEAKPVGILNLLEEECSLGKGTDTSFANKMVQHFDKVHSFSVRQLILAVSDSFLLPEGCTLTLVGGSPLRSLTPKTPTSTSRRTPPSQSSSEFYTLPVRPLDRSSVGGRRAGPKPVNAISRKELSS